jgi:hypothetical protein
MAASGVLLPEPIWYFVDNNGKPLGAGFLGTYRSLDKSTKKLVYQDPGLTTPYPDPIQMSENGTIPTPIFWAQDEAYYVVAYRNVNGLPDTSDPIWEVDNFSPSIVGGGGGGGGSITTYVSLTNYVGNNVHYHNLGTSASPIPAGTILAPGNHEGFTTSDTTIQKNNNSATDQIIFQQFAIDNNPFAGDVTPEYYLNYICSIAAAESYKFIRYPINLHVNSMEAQAISITLWGANFGAGSENVAINIRQYLGQTGVGGETVISANDIVTLIGTATLTAGSSPIWKQFTFSGTIPAIPGATTPGGCGDDAVYLELTLPLNATCNLGLAKPTLYLGTIKPTLSFDTYDQINELVSSARTGDLRYSMNSFSPFGWVPMNDGTIGAGTSSTGGPVVARANQDTFQLYSLLWTSVTSQTNGTNIGGTGYAQLYDSTGTPLAAVGGNPAADFLANRRIGLTKALGRVLGIAGLGAGLTTRALGQNLGEEAHLQTLNELFNHTHNTAGGQFVIDGIAGNIPLGTTGATTGRSSVTGSVTGEGGQTAFNVMQPTTFVNLFIKL